MSAVNDQIKSFLSLIDQINEDWVQSVKRSAQKLDELLRSRKFPIDSLQEHINEIGQELQKINVQSDAVSKLRAQFQQISEYVNNIDVFSSAVQNAVSRQLQSEVEEIHRAQQILGVDINDLFASQFASGNIYQVQELQRVLEEQDVDSQKVINALLKVSAVQRSFEILQSGDVEQFVKTLSKDLGVDIELDEQVVRNVANIIKTDVKHTLYMRDIFQRGEKVNRQNIGGTESVLVPVQDILTTAIGMKTKAQTGIAVDADLSIVKQQSQMQHFTTQYRQAAELLINQLRSSDSSKQLQEKQFEILSSIQYAPGEVMQILRPLFTETILQQQERFFFKVDRILIPKLGEFQQEAKRLISENITDPFEKQRALEIANQMIASISTEQFQASITGGNRIWRTLLDLGQKGKELAFELYSKAEQMSEPQPGVKIQYRPLKLFIQKVPEKMDDIDTEDIETTLDRTYRYIRRTIMKQQAVLDAQQREGLLRLLSSIEDLFFGKEQSVRSAVLDLQQDVYRFYQEGGAIGDSLAGQVASQFLKMSRDTAIEAFKVMATDVQKTVDKTNTKVVILPILNSLAGGQKRMEQNLAFASMYRQIAEGDINQFKQEAIFNQLRNKVANLADFGFTKDFIEGVKAGDATKPIKFMRELPRSQLAQNTQQMMNFLYSSMYEPIAKVLQDENIPQAIKEALQYQQIGQFIDIGATLGVEQGEQLIRRQVVGKIMRDVFTEELGLQFERMDYETFQVFIELTAKRLQNFQKGFWKFIAQKRIYTSSEDAFQDSKKRHEVASFFEQINKIFGISKKEYKKYFVRALADTVIERLALSEEDAKKQYEALQQFEKLRQKGKKSIRELMSKDELFERVINERYEVVSDDEELNSVRQLQLSYILQDKKPSKEQMFRFYRFISQVQEQIGLVEDYQQFGSKTFSDFVDSMYKRNVAGGPSIGYLLDNGIVQYAKRLMYESDDVLLYQSRIETEASMQPYQQLRNTLGKRADFSTPKGQLTTGYQKKIRSGVQTQSTSSNVDVTSIFAQDVLPMTAGIGSKEALEAQLQKEKGKLDIFSKQADEQDFDDLFEEDIENWEIKAKYVSNTFYTGIIESFGYTTPGGLVVLQGQPGAWRQSQRRQYEVQSKIFESRESQLSSMKAKFGQYATVFGEYMYKEHEELGIPVGFFQSTNTSVKYDVHRFVARRFLERQVQYSRIPAENLTQKEIDVMRQIAQQSTLTPEIDITLKQYLEKLDQSSLVQHMDYLAREKRFTTQQLMQSADWLREYAQQQGVDWDDFIQRLRSQVQQIYTRTMQSRTYQRQLVDWYFELPQNMLFIHRFNYQGIELQLQPHQLMDIISVSSPNTVGSMQGFRLYGHQASPIQEALSPFQLLTQSERAINTYLQNQQPVVISVDEVDEQYREQIDFIRRINSNIDVARIEFAGKKAEEIAGMVVPTIVVEKDIEQFFKDVLQTSLNLTGDQYYMSSQLKKSLRLVQRNPAGGFEEGDMPELFKITGVARSKGMVTATFDLPLYARLNIEGQQIDIPIGLVMNTQGKRKNKMAEFGQGQARMIKFLREEQKIQQFSEILEQIERADTTDINALDEVRKRLMAKLSNELMADIIVKTSESERHTGYRFPVIMHKIFYYIGQSTEPEWKPVSNLAQQVLPQFQMNFTSQLPALLLQADSSGLFAKLTVQTMNLRQAGSEQLQAAQIQRWQELGYITEKGNLRTKSLSRRLQFEVQKMNILNEMKTYAQVFRVQNDFVISNQERIRRMAVQYKQLQDKNPQLQSTQRALEVLQSAMENSRMTTALGTSVLSLTESQVQQLEEIQGSKLYLPAPMQYIMRKILGGRVYVGKGPWDTERTVQTVMQQALKRDGLTYLDIGGKKLQFYEYIMPMQFDYDFGKPYLQFEVETLMNQIQGSYSLLQAQAHGRMDKFEQQLSFYYKRAQSVQNQQYQVLSNTMAKKHGVAIYGVHATQSSTLPGVRLPQSQMRQMARQQMAVVKKRPLEALLGYVPEGIEIDKRLFVEESKLIAQIDVSDVMSKFSKYQVEALQIDYDEITQEFVVYVHSDVQKFTNEKNIERLIKSQVPFLQDRSIRIQFESDAEHRTRIAEAILRQYQGFLAIGMQDAQMLSAKAGDAQLQLKMNEMLEERQRNFGELWGYLQRQPIIGHMPSVRAIGFSSMNTIDVPQYVAEQIAGDDDGDKINVLPYIFIESGVYNKAGVNVHPTGIIDQLIYERNPRLLPDEQQKLLDEVWGKTQNISQRNVFRF